MQGTKTLQFPYTDAATGAHFRKLSTTFLSMKTSSGIHLMWDGKHRIYITLNSSFKNKVVNGQTKFM